MKKEEAQANSTDTFWYVNLKRKSAPLFTSSLARCTIFICKDEKHSWMILCKATAWAATEEAEDVVREAERERERAKRTNLNVKLGQQVEALRNSMECAYRSVFGHEEHNEGPSTMSSLNAHTTITTENTYLNGFQWRNIKFANFPPEPRRVGWITRSDKKSCKWMVREAKIFGTN